MSEEAKEMDFKDFLESVPPGKRVGVSGLAQIRIAQRVGKIYPLATPELYLYCADGDCEGDRWFEISSEESDLSDEHLSIATLIYKCKNCEKSFKVYSLEVIRDPGKSGGRVFKLGEKPQFGPPIPTKLYALIGSDLELFRKGRISENQGLGIAAFAYYRRVIENQKNRIFDEIIKSLKHIDSKHEIIPEIENAKKETRFTASVDSIKGSLPEAFFIEGHNPLTLLHSALSKNLHSGSDEECLAIAGDIRTIMAELASRLKSLSSTSTKLKEAVKNLVSPEK